MGKHVDQAVRGQVLADTKNGLKVSEASAKYGVHVKTICAWLRHQADNTGTSSLEIARLRRESQELKEIIGMSALEKRRAEKIGAARERMKAAKITVTALARKLGIARSALYYQPKRPPSDEALRLKIGTVMAEHPAYGHRRVALALGMNRKPVVRVMRLFGLKPRIGRGARPTKPGDPGRPETLIPNVLEAPCPLRPNVVWAGGLTFLWFQDRFWYVATVIDVFTREIVGWHVANHHTTALAIEAFKDAAGRTGRAPGWFRSDQGSEYVAGAYESLLASYGTVASQSRKSGPWQNGCRESFYSNFKLELGDIRRFVHVGELIGAVHQQIAYHNTRRIHSAVRMPPAKYREDRQQKIAVFAAVNLAQIANYSHG